MVFEDYDSVGREVELTLRGLGSTDFAARQRVSRAVRRMRKLMARDEEEEGAK